MTRTRLSLARTKMILHAVPAFMPPDLTRPVGGPSLWIKLEGVIFDVRLTQFKKEPLLRSGPFGQPSHRPPIIVFEHPTADAGSELEVGPAALLKLP